MPISLLHIFEKIFQTVIDNSLFRYFINNKLFTSCQSGFLSGNSCVSQLLSIINEIQTAFDENPTADLRGVFSNISQAFDKIWHDGLLYTLKAYGNQDELLLLARNYTHFWTTARIGGRTSSLSDLKKWYTRWHNLIIQSFCWWYITFFKRSKYI